MRTITLIFSALVLGTTAMKAQTVATLESLSLATADTYYVNYSAPATDVGFTDGLTHFPCIYDTIWGGIWSSGFAYSNVKDSVTSGYMNQYAAKAGVGYGGSNIYAVANCTFDYTAKVMLTGAAMGKKVNGVYVTNTTYAANAMRDGSAFSKKFGDTTGGKSPDDWFLLTIKGYSGGSLTADSVNFYLADFRFLADADDYIVKNWQWVNLLPLSNVDSLLFTMRSSDTAFGYINTPAYFAIDNFTNEVGTGVNEVAASIAKVYPNPASNLLYVDILDDAVKQIIVSDVAGRVIKVVEVTNAHVEINTSSFAAGVYMLQLKGDKGSATVRFQKQ
jgi:hypothetical protein